MVGILFFSVCKFRGHFTLFCPKTLGTNTNNAHKTNDTCFIALNLYWRYSKEEKNHWSHMHNSSAFQSPAISKINCINDNNSLQPRNRVCRISFNDNLIFDWRKKKKKNQLLWSYGLLCVRVVCSSTVV